jgi:hypothetical protein
VGNDIVALEVRPGDGVLKVGEAVQLNLFARKSKGGVDLVPANVATWLSSDVRVAEVNRQGRLSPRRPGSLTIAVAYVDLKVVAAFTVVE